MEAALWIECRPKLDWIRPEQSVHSTPGRAPVAALRRRQARAPHAEHTICYMDPSHVCLLQRSEHGWLLGRLLLQQFVRYGHLAVPDRPLQVLRHVLVPRIVQLLRWLAVDLDVQPINAIHVFHSIRLLAGVAERLRMEQLVDRLYPMALERNFHAQRWGGLVPVLITIDFTLNF